VQFLKVFARTDVYTDGTKSNILL